MAVLSGEKLLDALNWRYAVKKFDSEKKIDVPTWNYLEKSLVLTPSSYGLQPWRFLVIQDPAAKQKLRECSWNQAQVTDCSHYLVLAALTKLTEEHLDKYLTHISKIRNVPTETLAGFRKGVIKDAIEGPRAAIAAEWMARQCYIALGNVMTTAAVLGVDACPMEGLDPKKYDEVLGTHLGPYKTVVACAFGYRSAEDKYAQSKKVRFDSDQVVFKI
jgi:nitroreductase